MFKVEFLLEIVTPVFVHGSDTTRLELRIPSIKGMMRYWWRSLHPNITDIFELKNKECEIFGGKHKIRGFLKSEIRLVLNDINQKSLKMQLYKPVPTKNFKRSGIAPGQTFKIILYTRNEEFLEIGKNTLIISTILGGIGQRSRRGFGSIQIKEINGNNLNITDINKDFLIDIIRKINPFFEFQKEYGNKKYAFLKNIIIGDEVRDDWKILINKIGNTAHNKNSDFTGFAKGQNRLASPVYVSIIKNKNEKFVPIISILNTYFKEGWKPWGSLKKQSEFINEIVGVKNND